MLMYRNIESANGWSPLGLPMVAKGSRKNKFTFSSIEAPAWQGVKAPTYRDMSSFRNAARQDASALENVKLFLREP
jgi:hypothetical protein